MMLTQIYLLLEPPLPLIDTTRQVTQKQAWEMSQAPEARLCKLL